MTYMVYPGASVLRISRIIRRHQVVFPRISIIVERPGSYKLLKIVVQLKLFEDRMVGLTTLTFRSPRHGGWDSLDFEEDAFESVVNPG